MFGTHTLPIAYQGQITLNASAFSQLFTQHAQLSSRHNLLFTTKPPSLEYLFLYRTISTIPIFYLFSIIPCVFHTTAAFCDSSSTTQPPTACSIAIITSRAV